ncbi:MAG: class sortase [Candidatus Saccharibacteria bacterium]|nr:class sortase [Candidatus Saccharibacteria bacterium]
MRELISHSRWISSLRDVKISALLALLLFVFVVINASIYLLAKTPETAQAQNTPATSQTVKAETTEAQVTTATEASTAAATPQPAATQPAPAPTPPPAPKPAPAYDRVSIPSLGMSSRYVTVGLTATNAIDVHASLAGWWNGSAQPGNPGAVFLDGHNPGVFSKLPNIQAGAQISITKASGETFTYTVVHTETVQLLGINMRQALSTYGGAAEGLNLMTCVGAYNPKTGTTDQRFIVYAVRS